MVVTGAASGIGRALAAALRARGDRVVLADVDPAVGEVAAALGGEPWVVDVADPAAFARGFVDLDAADPVDLFVAAACTARLGDAATLDAADWDRILGVNLGGAVTAARVVYPRMVARGGGPILFGASVQGLAPALRCAPYVASKHAVVGPGRALRAEGRRHGVRVGVACPGYVRAPMLDRIVADGAAVVAPMTAERCAALVLRGADRDRGVYPVGRQAWAYGLAARWFRGVVDAVLARLAARLSPS